MGISSSAIPAFPDWNEDDTPILGDIKKTKLLIKKFERIQTEFGWVNT